MKILKHTHVIQVGVTKGPFKAVGEEDALPFTEEFCEHCRSTIRIELKSAFEGISPSVNHNTKTDWVKGEGLKAH